MIGLMIAFIFLLQLVSAIRISSSTSGIKITSFDERDSIYRDLIGGPENIHINSTFYVEINNSDIDEIDLTLTPFEFSYMDDATDISVSIFDKNNNKIVLCDGINPFCKLIKNETWYGDVKNFSQYTYRINFKKYQNNAFRVFFEYNIKNFTKINGDYHIAWFNTQCEICTGDINRQIILPSVNSILERFPADAEIGSIMQNDDKDKWFVTLKGNKKQDLVYYKDSKEIKWSSFIWAFFGAIIGGILSFILKPFELELNEHPFFFLLGFLMFLSLGILTFFYIFNYPIVWALTISFVLLICFVILRLYMFFVEEEGIKKSLNFIIPAYDKLKEGLKKRLKI